MPATLPIAISLASLPSVVRALHPLVMPGIAPEAADRDLARKVEAWSNRELLTDGMYEAETSLTRLLEHYNSCVPSSYNYYLPSALQTDMTYSGKTVPPLFIPQGVGGVHTDPNTPWVQLVRLQDLEKESPFYTLIRDGLIRRLVASGLAMAEPSSEASDVGTLRLNVMGGTVYVKADPGSVFDLVHFSHVLFTDPYGGMDSSKAPYHQILENRPGGALGDMTVRQWLLNEGLDPSTFTTSVRSALSLLLKNKPFAVKAYGPTPDKIFSGVLIGIHEKPGAGLVLQLRSHGVDREVPLAEVQIHSGSLIGTEVELRSRSDLVQERILRDLGNDPQALCELVRRQLPISDMALRKLLEMENTPDVEF